MHMYHGLAALHLETPAALTIGVFDGVHRGHQQLVGAAVAQAHALGGTSVVLTFDPHPDQVVRPARARPSLCSLDERLRLLAQAGVEHAVVLPFTAAVARLTAAQFMQDLAARLALRVLCVGYDFRLGYGGAGTVEVLRTLGLRLGYAVQTVPAALVGETPISSTLIRERLGVGDVGMATTLLGRVFTVCGPVVKGDQRGRTIGFPTANVRTPEMQLLPADGVYACRVQIAGEQTWRPAVTNVGVRPTFGVLSRAVEAHLLNWSGDLYGQTLTVGFVERLRGEQKFNSIEALKAQIAVDAAQAETLLIHG